MFIRFVASKNIYTRFSTWWCVNFNGSTLTAICASSELLLLLLLIHLNSLRWLIFITVVRWCHRWSCLIIWIALGLSLKVVFLIYLSLILLNRRLSLVFVLVNESTVVSCPADAPLTRATYHKNIRQK